MGKRSANRIFQKDQAAGPTSVLLVRSPQALSWHRHTRDVPPQLLPSALLLACSVYGLAHEANLTLTPNSVSAQRSRS